jgi:hypothetical protein
MSNRLSAQEFYQSILTNEAQSGFFESLATELDADVNRLRALFAVCKVRGGKSVAALSDLYQIYIDAPEVVLDESEDADESAKLTQRQKAILNQRSKRHQPELKPDDILDNVMELLQENPGLYPTENWYMAHGAYSITTVRSIFGTWEEVQRAVGLRLSRGQHQLQRQVAKHVSLDVYREFYHQEVLPYANQYQKLDKRGRMKFGMSVSDLHDIDCDPFSLAVALDRAKDCQPDIILLNGDVFDQPEFGRWDVDPRNYRIKERFDFVKEHIFAAFRKAAPSAQIDFVIGNHDWRILKLLAEKTPHLKVILSDVMGLSLADIFGVHDYEINLVTKGDLDFSAHTKKGVKGELLRNYKVYNDNAGNPIYIANHFGRGKFQTSGTSGHLHRPIIEPYANEHGIHTWMTTPGMAKREAHYVEMLDQAQNGFGFFHLDMEKGGVQQELVNTTHDFCHVHGRYYYRNDLELVGH